MSDSEHTPGPWAVSGSIKSVNGDDLYVGYVFPDVEGYRGDVCSVQSADHISGITRDEAAANASLIASAPNLLAERDRLREVNAELLAALEAFAAIHDNSPDNTPWGCGLTNGHFFRAKEAIAKAKGVRDALATQEMRHD